MRRFRTRVLFAAAVASFALAGLASAADLPQSSAYTKAPAIQAPAYSWTGCYVGAEGGGNWGRADGTAVTPLNPALNGQPITGSFGLAGGLAGGTVGCNYQMGVLVVGIEADASWTSTSGSTHNVAPFNPLVTNNLGERWFDTARGRIGYTWDRALFYATAGGAFAGTRLLVCSGTGAVCVPDSQTRSGWSAGAGVEYAFWDNWSVKLEYLHADLGHKNYISPAVTIDGLEFRTRSVGLTDDLVRVGVNYHFGGAAIAKY